MSAGWNAKISRRVVADLLRCMRQLDADIAGQERLVVTLRRQRDSLLWQRGIVELGLQTPWADWELP